MLGTCFPSPQVAREGFRSFVIGASVPQLLLDVFCIYWIINAIVNTRRTLRLRRNIKKLAFYDHLLYTFVFAVIGETVGLVSSRGIRVGGLGLRREGGRERIS